MIAFNPAAAAFCAIVARDVDQRVVRWRSPDEWPLWRWGDLAEDSFRAGWRWLDGELTATDSDGDYEATVSMIGSVVRGGAAALVEAVDAASEAPATFVLSVAPYLANWGNLPGPQRRALLYEFESVNRLIGMREVADALKNGDRDGARTLYRTELARSRAAHAVIEALPSLFIVKAESVACDYDDPAPPVLLGNGLTVLFGLPGAGKSTIAAWLLRHLDKGEGLRDGWRKCRSLAVLTAGEDRVGDFGKRFVGSGVDAAFVELDPLSTAGLDDLDRSVAQLREYDVLFVDSRDGLASQGADLNSGTVSKELLGRLCLLAENAGVSVLLVAHGRKSAGKRLSIEDLAGSVQNAAACRVVLGCDVEDQPDGRDRLLARVLKSNLGGVGQELRFTRNGADLHFDGIFSTESVEDAQARKVAAAVEHVFGIVDVGGKMSVKELQLILREHGCTNLRDRVQRDAGLEPVQEGGRVRGLVRQALGSPPDSGE